MKKIVVVIFIIAIYVVGMIICTNLLNNEIYLYMGNNIRWHYKNEKWENLNNNIPYNNFKVYNTLEMKYMGRYNIKYEDNNWYIKKGKYQLIDYPALMYKGNKKINIISYDEKDLDDSNVKMLLKSQNLDMNNYTGYYIEIDLDNDEKKEKIYCVTNSEVIGINTDMYYSIIYVEKDSKYIEVCKETSKDRFDNTYWINMIIDIDNDNIYELLVTKTDISQNEDNRIVKMYGLENNQYIELIGD